MTQNSQNNPVWAHMMLGDSTTDTIGRFGCTITSIGNYIGLTPPQVNDALKANGGFADIDLVNWTKLNACLPQVQFITKGAYNNDAVLQAIKLHGACLVEVQVKGGGSHWPLYIGNGVLIDPWDGEQHPTSIYPTVLSYVELSQVAQQPVPMPQPQGGDEVITDQTKINMAGSFLNADGTPAFGDMEVQAVRSTINDQAKTIAQDQVDAASKQQSIEQLTEQSKSLAVELDTCQAQVSVLQQANKQLLDPNTTSASALLSLLLRKVFSNGK